MSRQSASEAAEKSKESKNEAKSKKEKEELSAGEENSSAAEDDQDQLEDPVEDTSPEEETSETDEEAEIASESDSSADEPSEETAEIDDDESTEEEVSDDALTEEERYQKEIKELNDKFMRLAAEFDNFKKRSNQEMQSRFKYASQPLAMAIISGLDSLERAIDQAEQAIEEEDITQFKEFVAGINMVKQQFYDAFKNNSIERTFPKGDLFDPNIHEAMGVIESDKVEADHIAEVFQAGYYLHDRVIRPAMVQVAKKK